MGEMADYANECEARREADAELDCDAEENLFAGIPYGPDRPRRLPPNRGAFPFFWHEDDD